ncbi:MAG: CBS domain-containing protein [Candidatus Diapherotrites archaeon]|nr:CBS domain-containing protein [Candidatus Diapherotrites archaeon]
MQKAVYYYYLRGKRVVDVADQPVGTVCDLVIADGVERAEVLALVVRNGGQPKKIGWKQVEGIERNVFLKKGVPEIEWETVNENDLLVNEILLDRQLVDADGLKVMRINDLFLSSDQNKLWVSGVCVGTRGFLRRLGFEKPLWNWVNRMPEQVIPWKDFEPLDPRSSIKMTVSRTKLSKAHPADLASLMDSMTATERAIIFESLTEKKAAATLAHAGPEVKKTILERVTSEKIKKTIQRMDADEIADLMELLSSEEGKELLKAVDYAQAKQVKKIMAYPKKSAATIMTTHYLFVSPEMTGNEALAYLQSTLSGVNRNYYLFVLDSENHLLGYCSLRKLLISDPAKKVREFMDESLVSIRPDDPVEDVAKLFSKYRAFALPVVDAENRLQGIITMDDVLIAILPPEIRKRRVRRRVRRNPQETNPASEPNGKN